MAPSAIEIPDDELAAACARRDETPHARGPAEAAFGALYDRHAKRNPKSAHPLANVGFKG